MSQKIHLSLNVTNIEKSVEFYTALFGEEPVKLKSDYAKFDLESPAVNLTMTKGEVKPGNQVSHLGIQVSDSSTVLSQKQRLEALGLLTKLEEKTNCCYALQDKVWVKDPDGNPWEVFVVLSDGKEIKSDRSSCCA